MPFFASFAFFCGHICLGQPHGFTQQEINIIHHDGITYPMGRVTEADDE